MEPHIYKQHMNIKYTQRFRHNETVKAWTQLSMNWYLWKSNSTFKNAKTRLVTYKNKERPHLGLKSAQNPTELSKFRSKHWNTQYWQKSSQRIIFHNFTTYDLKSSKRHQIWNQHFSPIKFHIFWTNGINEIPFWYSKL